MGHKTVHKKALFYFTLIAVWALLPSLTIHAQGIGVVTAVRGTATVTRQPAAQPKAVSFKEDLFWEDVFNTGAESRLRMLILKKSVITMQEQSRLHLREEAATPTQPRGKSIINLLLGSLRAVVAKDALRDRDYEIHTNIAVAAIRGSDVVSEKTSNAESNFYTGPGATATVTTPGVLPADLAPLQRARVTPNLIEVTQITRSFYDILRAATSPAGAATRAHRSAKSKKAEKKASDQSAQDTFWTAAFQSVFAAIDRCQDPAIGAPDSTACGTGSGSLLGTDYSDDPPHTRGK